MEIVNCPICGKPLEIILDATEIVDWNKPLREHTHIIFCNNCKRKIRYSIKTIEKR
jgi:uncharacterized protein YbaR (Trm112 family)